MFGLFRAITHFLQKNLFGLLVFAYVIATLYPGPGVCISHCWSLAVGKGTALQLNLSVPQLLLSFLLFNAGMGCRLKDFAKQIAHPKSLLLGVSFNLVAPFVLIALISRAGSILWRNNDELQSLLVGLTIVGSMPIAGASTTWAQAANANEALILGLVTITTLISPFSAPLFFKIVAPFLNGDFREDVLELGAHGGLQTFLFLSVAVPSITGMGVGYILGDGRAVRLREMFKGLALCSLLILNYSNASGALPSVFRAPDWDFLAMITLTTFLFCTCGFMAGWFLPKLANANEADRKAVMFGLGMNNNGTGLVLASASLPDHVMVILPIVIYNLGQHVIAGLFLSALKSKSGADPV